MAVRPVFVADIENGKVFAKTIDFQFYNGFAKSQKQKCIESLHNAAAKKIHDIRTLEVSSFSKKPLGISLSAFNLQLSTVYGPRSVEQVYQAGKVFEHGGPYLDLLERTSSKAKRDERLRNSGCVIGFVFDNKQYPITPTRLFYTFLYLKALSENPELGDKVIAGRYNGFTDIVFNPQKSVNCQAYSLAVYVVLRSKGLLETALSDMQFLTDFLLDQARITLH